MLAQVVPEQPTERAHDRRDRDSHSIAPSDERDRHPGQQPDLDRAPGRAVEQVGEIRGQRDENRVGEQPPARDEGNVRGEYERDRGTAEDLERAGRDPTRGEGAQVPTKAAVALGAQEVVDQPEQAEAEAGEEHQRPGEIATRFVAQAERSQCRAAGLHDENGEHHQQTRASWQRAVPEVAALQRGRVEQVAPTHDEQPNREETHDEPQDDGHEGTTIMPAFDPAPASRDRRARSRRSGPASSRRA